MLLKWIFKSRSPGCSLVDKCMDKVIMKYFGFSLEILEKWVYSHRAFLLVKLCFSLQDGSSRILKQLYLWQKAHMD